MAEQTESGSPSGHRLARTMGLFSLVVYGVGDMVGSGIYGTIGKAADQLGNAVWLAMCVSMVAALLTGLSYASIASRYPRAAGAAYVTHRAYGRPVLSYVVGLTVTVSGLTSMATSSNVFAGALAKLLGVTGSLGRMSFNVGSYQAIDGDVAAWLLLVVFLAMLTLVNFWGIRQSMWVNLLCTTVEVGGLLLIVIIGLHYWGDVRYFETPNAHFDPASGEMQESGLSPQLLFSGAVLTFFAFVGFEDMLNVSEEVKRPERTMPIGIVLSLLTTTVLYIAVSITAVSVVDYKTLARAPAPLSAITDRAATWIPASTYDFITLFAVANTVLINYIMGSRLLFGMAGQGLVPKLLGRIHPQRRTPHVAILCLFGLVLLLSLSGGVADLAAATGLLLLVSFMIVNTALMVLQLRASEPKGSFEVPLVVPLCGAAVNLTLIVARVSDPAPSLQRAPLIAGVLIAVIGLLYFILRPRGVTEESLAALD